MAVDDALAAEELQKFQLCSKKLARLVYRNTDDFRAELRNVFDDFNSIEYSVKIVNEEVAGTTIAKCCYLVPCDNPKLLSQFAQLVVNLVSRQQLVLVTNAGTVTEYIIKVLPTCQSDVKVDLLKALSAVLYENTHTLAQHHDDLVGKDGILIFESDSTDDEIQRSNTQCLQNICLRVPGCSYLSEDHQARCYQALIKIIQRPPPTSQDDANHCRRVVSCVRGLHNLVMATKTCPQEFLGPILAALKVYMLYGLPGQQTSILPTLYPRPMPLADPPKTPVTPRAKQSAADEVSLRPGSTSKRGRKKGRGRGKAQTSTGGAEEGPTGAGESPVRAGLRNLSLTGEGASRSAEGSTTDGAGVLGSFDQTVQSLFQPWRQGYSSESDFSDTEGGQAAKLRGYHSNVRHCSLGCLHALAKAVEKRIMFGYWSSFLPDGPAIGAPTQGQTLFTSIMKDSSPKARSGALVVLSALVEGSKQYMVHADDSEQSPATFTPFSVSLGYMVKELHRGLLFALAAENSPLVLTQIFKCLAVLVPNVPYQKLRPGLLNRIIKHIKPFLAHREPNIRVACLTCLGSIVSVQAPLMEVWQALQAMPPVVLAPPQSPTSLLGPLLTSGDGRPRHNSESGYLNTPVGAPLSAGSSPRVVSGAVTPTLSSGCVTPSLMDSTVGSGDMPWIVKLCVNNVTPSQADRSTDWSSNRSFHSQPQPVKLESLQLLALLSKGYFLLIKNSLLTICDLIQKCLEESDPSIQLHGAKLLEELGAAILQQLKLDLPAQSVDITQVEEMWVRILSGPLPRILQEPARYAVRATACDCLANIGPQVFDKLQVDKRMLCITLLLGFTSDSDYHVRASAVRALGVYVLYPCLRDDVSFVADVANAIINGLQESNLSIKVKAAWSLGNLSDALVLNRDAGEQAFIDDFADMLLLKLFEVATKASQDNDKVKANAVRGLGGLLRYLPPRSYNSVRFNAAVEAGIKSLVKTITSGTMKIRWNACYATANMFRNSLLPLGEASWTNSIHSALASVVKDCKNFKVRINAAMAFSIPQTRKCYGEEAMFRTIWVSLVVGLLESESIADFAEFKYRDSLMEQVIKTLLHLVTVISVSDLEMLEAALEPHLGPLYPYMERFYELQRAAGATDSRDLEIAAPAIAHLKALEEKGLSPAQDITVKKLLHLLEATKEGPVPPSARPDSPPVPSFSQTYN